MEDKPIEYKFSFGPWNIHEGADPFGPTVRDPVDFARKVAVYKQLGFDGIQFHDDDAVRLPGIMKYTARTIRRHANATRKLIEGEGLTPEFVAPRLWEHRLTVDGAYTSNDPDARIYALERTKRAIDSSVTIWL